MRCLLPAIFVFVSLAFSSSEISAQSLTTTSSSNTGSNGNMFDVSNNGTSSITITGFSQNFNNQSPVASFEVYTRSGGLTTSSSGWSLRNSTGSFTPEVRDTLTQLSFTSPVSITINAGETTGLYLRSDRNNAYTKGTSVGAIAATNSNLTIYEGYGVYQLFGIFFSPRIWNGTIFYSVNTVNTVNTDNRDKSSIQYRPVAQTVNPDLFQTNIPVCESNLWLSGMSVVGNGKVTHYVDYKNKDECFKYEVKVLPEDVDSRSEAQVFKHLGSSDFDVYKYRPS
jgi:hypothetical protein